jgi:hypothetical protein
MFKSDRGKSKMSKLIAISEAIEPYHLESSAGDQNHQAMNEIYNPNPTILKNAGKRGTRAFSDLWDLDEGQTGGCGLYNDHSVSESIDQNEIFGRHPSPPIAVS